MRIQVAVLGLLLLCACGESQAKGPAPARQFRETGELKGEPFLTDSTFLLPQASALVSYSGWFRVWVRRGATYSVYNIGCSRSRSSALIGEIASITMRGGVVGGGSVLGEDMEMPALASSRDRIAKAFCAIVRK